MAVSTNVKDDVVILVTGDRNWTDYDMVLEALSKFKDKSVLLIHGDCKGADKLAGKAAKELHFLMDAQPADWTRYGKAAGFIRNTEMVKQAILLKEEGIPVYVLAFHDNLELSKGTKHCVEQAKKYGLSVELYSH